MRCATLSGVRAAGILFVAMAVGCHAPVVARQTAQLPSVDAGSARAPVVAAREPRAPRAATNGDAECWDSVLIPALGAIAALHADAAAFQPPTDVTRTSDRELETAARSLFDALGRPPRPLADAERVILERAARCGVPADPTSVAHREPPTIQEVVRAHLGGLEACYEAALLRHPQLAGYVATRFIIVAGGAVPFAKDVSDTHDATKVPLADPEARQCVVDRFRELQFDAISGTGLTTVVYPLVFEPGD